MTLGATRIRELLDRHRLAPSRALGQNFVVDPNTVRRIAALAGAGPGHHVLEIGPGLGSLTLALAERGSRVTAVEADRHLLPALAEVIAGREAGESSEPPTYGPVRIVHADALDVDLAELLVEAPRWRLAANLPYNVGTTILLRIMEEAPSVSGGVVMVQREVADRLVARPGDRVYGIPSVKLAWWADARRVGRVPAAVFHPRPRVESALVGIERRDPPGDEMLRERVFALVDAGFAQRRKMLRRSLSGLLGPHTGPPGPDPPTGGAFEMAGVDPTARAEALALDDWVRLARWCP